MNGLERAQLDYEGDTPDDLDACDECAGSGYRNNEPCRNCGGDGVIEYDHPMHETTLDPLVTFSTEDDPAARWLYKKTLERYVR